MNQAAPDDWGARCGKMSSSAIVKVSQANTEAVAMRTCT